MVTGCIRGTPRESSREDARLSWLFFYQKDESSLNVLFHVLADECTAVMKTASVASVAKLVIEVYRLVAAFNDNGLEAQFLYPFLGTFNYQPSKASAAVVFKYDDPSNLGSGR